MQKEKREMKEKRKLKQCNRREKKEKWLFLDHGKEAAKLRK